MSLATIASLLDGQAAWSGQVRPAHEPLAAGTPAAATTRPPLKLRVVWGDLTGATAGIHVVGHYQGVLPAGAEAALDRAISPGRGVIADHTRRRWLVGELGEISYFPGIGSDSGAVPGVQRVAVAGMGRLGTFNDANAERLYASILRELSSFACVRRAAMVLIGSGAGNLAIPQAARALVRGFTAARKSLPDCALDEILLVEVDRLRAEQLRVALQILTRDSAGVAVAGGIETGHGGRVEAGSAGVFVIRALAQAIRGQTAGNGSASPAALDGLRATLPAGLADQICACIAQVPDDINALDVVIGRSPGAGNNESPPTRISVAHHGDRILWAALTDRATIPEREVPVKPKLVEDLVQRLTAPSREDADKLPRMLRRWVVPADLQDHVNATSPLVLEVNGAAAQLPWEFLTDRPYDEGEEPLPLAVRTPVARQLRTSYARTVSDHEVRSGLRALVIADPGPVSQRLPGAYLEGLAVRDLLVSRGVSVELFAGAPGTTPPSGARVATQLDVLRELLVGRYDLVHFAGHGTLPNLDRPELAGWLFSDGVLAARELAQLSWAPRLIVANACWTGAGLGAPTGPAEAVLRAGLTAVLADEFLRVGVAHYIGTSWAVPDDMAKRFALSFYGRVLPAQDTAGETFGAAICEARRVLFGMRDTATEADGPELFNAWAAYQHYGDPADVIDVGHAPGV